MMFPGRHRIAATALVLASLSTAAVSSADEPSLSWNPAWPGIHWSEYVTTGVFLPLGSFGGFVVPQRVDKWTGDFLFDRSFQKRVRAGDRGTRETAVILGDVLFYGLWAYPAVVDVGIAAMAVHRSWDVAWNMLWIDLQAYSIAGSVGLLTQKLVGRRRPFVERCSDEPDYDPDCGDDDAGSQSFISGHVGIAFTGAGLMCAHHAHLDLYGGGWGDVMACSMSLLGASVVAGARLVGDRHYLSDVVFGAVNGLAWGYLMPELLHYRFSLADEAPMGSAAVTVLPLASGDTLGVQLVGYQ
jgi:membrane-associated phospholipid phosphatase